MSITATKSISGDKLDRILVEDEDASVKSDSVSPAQSINSGKDFISGKTVEPTEKKTETAFGDGDGDLASVPSGGG